MVDFEESAISLFGVWADSKGLASVTTSAMLLGVLTGLRCVLSNSACMASLLRPNMNLSWHILSPSVP